MLLDVPAYQRITKDTASATTDVTAALADAQAWVEQHCNRFLERATYTETLRVAENGYVYPSATPLVSVSSPPSLTITGAGVYVGYLSFPSVTVASVSAAFPLQTTVTYVGGYTPATLPVTLRRAIARVARLMLTPAVLAGAPAGATSVSLGDVRVSGRLSALPSTDPGIDADLAPYVKRQVVGWQSVALSISAAP